MFLLVDASAISLPIETVTVTGFPLLGKESEMSAASRDPLKDCKAVLEDPAEIGVEVIAIESELVVV